jgi:hypothetical protein
MMKKTRKPPSRSSRDKADAKAAETVLKRKWGSHNYHFNIDLIEQLLEDLSITNQDLAHALCLGRLSDQRRLLNDPTFAHLLLGVAKARRKRRLHYL